MLAEGFINADVDGKAAGKAQWSSHFKGGTWEQNEIGDVKVMVYGNTRIATGAWTGKGVERDGSKVDSHERSTDGMGEDAGW
jgi:ketosteroid isomerase-like protein